MADKPKNPATKGSPYYLLVEGSSDMHAIIHLLARHGYDWDSRDYDRPFVLPYDGVPQLPEAITAHKTRHALGIVVDADEHPERRWQQVKSWLADVVRSVPDAPDPNGLFLDSKQSGGKVGVWLMPDNRSQGALEDFVRDLVPPGDVCWDYAGQHAQAAKDRYTKGRPPSDRYARGAQSFGYDLKSQLHTWLAWQDEPGMSLGQALNKKLLGSESETAKRFKEWFEKLFPKIKVSA